MPRRPYHLAEHHAETARQDGNGHEESDGERQAVSGKELLDYNGFSLWGLSEVPGNAAAIAEDYKTLNAQVWS